MKFLKKCLLSAAALCFVFFLTSSISVFADGGSWTNQNLADASWSYNGAGTLTLNGRYINAPLYGYIVPDNPIGWREGSDVPWSAYQNEIRHVVINGDFSLQADWEFDLTGNLGNGFSWHYDAETKSAVLSGRGDFPYSASLYSMPNDLKSLTIGDGVTSVSALLQHGAAWEPYTIQTVIIGKDLKPEKNLNRWTIFAPVQDYVLDSRNPYLALYDGVLYSSDYRILLRSPETKTSVRFPEGVKIINARAFFFCPIKEVIVPWGVESVGSQALSLDGGDWKTPSKVVFPDTIIELVDWGGITDQRPPIYVNAYYSKYNQPLDWAFDRTYMNYGFRIGVPLESTKEYYPGAVLTGWQRKGEEFYYYDKDTSPAEGWRKIDYWWFCFDENGRMLKRQWIETDGVWYYLYENGVMAANEWVHRDFDDVYFFVDRSGAMLMRSWLYRDGSWYYLNGGGRRAKNCWVYYPVDGKYYYLGSDGAMLTSTVTPDGCTVGSDGAWIP